MITLLAKIFRGLHMIVGITAPGTHQSERSLVLMWLGIMAFVIAFCALVFCLMVNVSGTLHFPLEELYGEHLLDGSSYGRKSPSADGFSMYRVRSNSARCLSLWARDEVKIAICTRTRRGACLSLTRVANPSERGVFKSNKITSGTGASSFPLSHKASTASAPLP